MITSALAYSDNQYLEAFRRGDERLIQDLYDKGFRLSHTEIRDLGVDEESVSEIYQDSFCVLYEKAKRPDFHLTSQITTYLIGICKNKAKSFCRKQSKYVPLPPNAEGTDVGAGELVENEYEQIEEAKRTLFLEEFNRMKENKGDCYSLIKLSYLDGESSISIAQILNKASGDVVKTQKNRCLSYLKKAIFKRM